MGRRQQAVSCWGHGWVCRQRGENYKSKSMPFAVRFLYIFPRKVLVMLVDYGNLVQVPRCKIWAPVIGLQLFTLPPFGVRCQVENVPKVTLQQWQCALFEKPLRVIFDSCFPVNGYFTVHLPDCMVNSTIIEVLKDYGQISLLTPSRYDQPLFFQFPSGN